MGFNSGFKGLKIQRRRTWSVFWCLRADRCSALPTR